MHIHVAAALSAILISTTSNALLQPTNTDATCMQKRTTSDPSGSAISAALASASAVSNACGFGGKQTDTKIGLLNVLSYRSGSLLFNTSSSAFAQEPLPVSANFCSSTFNSIISKCLVNGQFWGGWLEQGSANYTITDSVYPANPLPSESPQPTSTKDTSTSSQSRKTSSRSHSSTATSSTKKSTTAGPPLTIIKTYSADISSTTIPGVTVATHTSTGDSSHPSAIVPILVHCWFCPPGDASFLLWGFIKPGIYPPPPNPPVPSWPTITIGNDMNPTPDPSKSPSASKTASETSKPSASPSGPSGSSSPSGSAQVCKREIENPMPRIGKRGEQVIAGTDPLKSALLNLGDPSFLDPANNPNIKLITNRAMGAMEARKKGLKNSEIPKGNFFVTGLTGHLNIPADKQPLKINGQTMTSPMPWTIRWDYDPQKSAHVNAEFGKGANNPTFAYTFSTGNSSYGETYMKDAVQLLTQTARLDIQASIDGPQPVFLQGTDLAEATQNIINQWKQILEAPCPGSGKDIQNQGNPNLPP